MSGSPQAMQQLASISAAALGAGHSAAPRYLKREKFIAEYFPKVDCGGAPSGSYIHVQLRMVKKKSAGGLLLADETRDFNKGQTCLGIVRALGPIAYCNRGTGEPWPEGAWAKVGQIVMVRRNEGRRFEIPIPGTDEHALFVVTNDNTLDWVFRDDFENFESVFDQII